MKTINEVLLDIQKENIKGITQDKLDLIVQMLNLDPETLTKQELKDALNTFLLNYIRTPESKFTQAQRLIKLYAHKLRASSTIPKGEAKAEDMLRFEREARNKYQSVVTTVLILYVQYMRNQLSFKSPIRSTEMAQVARLDMNTVSIELFLNQFLGTQSTES